MKLVIEEQLRLKREEEEEQERKKKEEEQREMDERRREAAKGIRSFNERVQSWRIIKSSETSCLLSIESRVPDVTTLKS